MSLSYEKLTPILVRSPVTDLQPQGYAVLEGGQQTLYRRFTTNSVSTSSLVFTCPPPNANNFVSRKVYVELPVRLHFTGTSPVGKVLLNAEYDAPRALPIQQALSTLQVQINGQTVSINSADVVGALLRYNNTVEFKNGNQSLTACALDMSSDYDSLTNSPRNPLGVLSDVSQQGVQPRGGFPFTVVSNTNTTAIVDVIFTEMLLLPPFLYDEQETMGFINVTTLDVTLNFLNDAPNRMWSHATQAGTYNITSMTMEFPASGVTGGAWSYSETAPAMLFEYVKPRDTQVVPGPNDPTTYPFFQIQRYPTTYGNIVNGASATITSNNLQLKSIPRRMYIFARNNNNTLFSNPSYTDTYLGLQDGNPLSILWESQAGLLSAANKRQIYDISVKNGLQMDWSTWSGDLLQSTSFGTTYSGAGSIVCLEFGTDIPLSALQAPGMNGQFTLQVTMNVQNNTGATVNADMYLIIVYEGSATLTMGNCLLQIGVITAEDVLEAESKPSIPYHVIKDIQGGNFLSGLKSGLKNIGSHFVSGLKSAVDFGKDIAPYIQKAVEVGKTIAPYAKDLAPLVGLGEGGVVVPLSGGRKSIKGGALEEKNEVKTSGIKMSKYH